MAWWGPDRAPGRVPRPRVSAAQSPQEVGLLGVTPARGHVTLWAHRRFLGLFSAPAPPRPAPSPARLGSLSNANGTVTRMGAAPGGPWSGAWSGAQGGRGDGGRGRGLGKPEAGLRALGRAGREGAGTLLHPPTPPPGLPNLSFYGEEAGQVGRPPEGVGAGPAGSSGAAGLDTGAGALISGRPREPRGWERQIMAPATRPALAPTRPAGLGTV